MVQIHICDSTIPIEEITHVIKAYDVKLAPWTAESCDAPFARDASLDRETSFGIVQSVNGRGLVQGFILPIGLKEAGEV